MPSEKGSRIILDQSKLVRLESFLKKIKKETYSEPISEVHTTITNKMFEYVSDKFQIASNNKVLDVGCGQGVALELFVEQNFSPIGITLNREDYEVCKNKGYEVYEMDQSFLDFNEEEFDLIWCRHCLEHSIFPFYTLSEFYRVLKRKGYLYVEVPAPDTASNHQANPNHYSVLGKSMWAELIKHAGFIILDIVDINFEVLAGSDTYWAFIQKKSQDLR